MTPSVSKLPQRLFTGLLVLGAFVVTLVLLLQQQQQQQQQHPQSNPTGTAIVANTTATQENDDLVEITQATVLQALVHRWKTSLAPGPAATTLCARNGILCPDECEHWHYFRRYVSGWTDRADDDDNCLDGSSSTTIVDEDVIAVSVAAMAAAASTANSNTNTAAVWRRPIYTLCDPDLQNRSAILMCQGGDHHNHHQVNWDYFSHGGQFEQDCTSSDVWVRLVHGLMDARTVVSLCAEEEEEGIEYNNSNNNNNNTLVLLQLWANAVAPILLQDESPCAECQAHHILARDIATFRLYRKYIMLDPSTAQEVFQAMDYYVCRAFDWSDGREWFEMVVPHNETVDPEVATDCEFILTANTPQYQMCDEAAEGLAMCNDNGTLNTTFLETLGYPGQDCTSADFLVLFVSTPWMIHMDSSSSSLSPCDGHENNY